MYGSKSWSWCRSTLAYAVFTSKLDTWMPVTRLHAVTAGGVTLLHVLPSSVVTWMSPSSVPAHTRPACFGDGASAYTTPRLPLRSTCAAAAASRFGGTPGSG